MTASGRVYPGLSHKITGAGRSPQSCFPAIPRTTMRHLFPLLLLTVAALPARAADKLLAYPVPAVYPTPDGKHTFVLIPPKSDDPRQKEATVHQGIRDTYPKGSGLYRSDDPSAPLWTVDWYAYDVFPADDAVSLVRVHGENMMSRHYIAGRPLPEETVAAELAAPALTFYRSGRPLRTYSVRELVQNPDVLPQTMDHILWMAGGTLTKDGKKFVLQTHDSRQHIFDLATGVLVESRAAGLGNEARLWVIRTTMAVVGLAAVVVLGLYLYHTRERKAA